MRLPSSTAVVVGLVLTDVLVMPLHRLIPLILTVVYLLVNNSNLGIYVNKKWYLFLETSIVSSA